MTLPSRSSTLAGTILQVLTFGLAGVWWMRLAGAGTSFCTHPFLRSLRYQSGAENFGPGNNLQEYSREQNRSGRDVLTLLVGRSPEMAQRAAIVSDQTLGYRR